MPSGLAFSPNLMPALSRLRKLVEPDPANPRYIQTVWGFGYVYVPDESEADSERAAVANDTAAKGDRP